MFPIWSLYLLAFGILAQASKDIQEIMTELDRPIPVYDVSGVLWKRAQLPCDITPSRSDDKVFMVLWFKDEDAEPIYSYDIRNRAPNQAKLWSSDRAFGNRAVFRATSNPAKLMIENVQSSDEAVYTCRVDYRNSPTRHAKVNLTVIVLPSIPVIKSSSNMEIETVLNPLNEGSVLSLTCEVTGGRPLPSVYWFLDRRLIDDTYENFPNSVSVNHLLNMKLTRDHLNGQLQCEANNTILASPSSRLVLLNMNLKPLKVEILHKERQLSVDREYEMECLASGSRPTAQITWYIGDKFANHVALKFPNMEHQVISILKFTPRMEDNGNFLICRAENPAISGSVIEDRLPMDVLYEPKVSLKLGPSLDPRSIKEGDDVYFECSVKANPKIFRQVWYHNGEELHQNVSAGIIMTDRSLVLQKVSKEDSGNYSCAATNSEGRGVSNLSTLRILYAPSCKNTREQLHGALKQETVTLKCEVDSNPKPSVFHWTFNNSGDSSLVSSSRYTNKGFVSVLNYTPEGDMDYGTLACWAQNPVGHQRKPCLYQVVAAGRPLPLVNCSITNQTEEALQVQCWENFDGGLPQHFLMELLQAPSMQSKFNVTVHTKPPIFHLRGIQSASSYKVKLFAVNAKGASDPVVLETSSFKGAAKYTSTTKIIAGKLGGMTFGILGASSAVVALACVIAIFVLFYRKKCSEGRGCWRPRPRPRHGPRGRRPSSKAGDLPDSPERHPLRAGDNPDGTARNSDNEEPDIITNIVKDDELEMPSTSKYTNGINFNVKNESAMNGEWKNSGNSTRSDTYVIQPSGMGPITYTGRRRAPEVVTASTKLQESCI